MKKTFVDPETGWIVTQEPSTKRWPAGEVIEETITNPRTGETHHCTQYATFRESVAEWLESIARSKVASEEIERERKERVHELYPELAAGAEVPAGPLGKIKLRFAEDFAFWSISLPEEDVVNRHRGKILRAGWAIWYLFGSDEKGEYLDYYATHRMTNDRHVRLYADGSEEWLPAMPAWGRSRSDDPVKDEELKAEYLAECREIDRMLKAKGFR